MINALFFASLTIKTKYYGRPIKETPILYRKDAERFLKRMNENHKVTPEENARGRANYEAILKIFEG